MDNTKKLLDKARQIELKIYSLQSELVKIRRKISKKEIEQYILETATGKKRLDVFFGDKSFLVLVHNMGKSCPYCTVYADSINVMTSHLQAKAEVLLISPDDPLNQREFATLRKWKFQLASTRNSSISYDLGFEPRKGNYLPGICILERKRDGSIWVLCKDDFEPGDRYSPLWHILALIDGQYDEKGL